MSIRGLCGSRGTSDYFGKNDTLEVDRALDDTDLAEEHESGSKSEPKYTPVPGGPFSAILGSLWPQAILKDLVENPDRSSLMYDEFGFIVDPEDKKRKFFEENSQQKLQWVAHLEFSANDKARSDLTWDKLQYKISHTEKLKSMILNGIPHSLRSQMWMRLSGAVEKKFNSEVPYGDIVRNSLKIHRVDEKLLEKDIQRVFPTHPCFQGKNAPGINRLRRVIRSLVWTYPNIGYCPGYGSIVAPLILFMEENDAFWLMCTIIEQLLPPSYFAHGMLGAQADQKVLADLIRQYLPEISEKFTSEDIDFSLITISWFISLFSNVLAMPDLLLLWDCFFYEGSVALFQVTCGMLRLKKEEIIQMESAALFNFLSGLPNEVGSVSLATKIGLEITPDLTPEIIHQKRQGHLAVMMTAAGSLYSPSFPFNLPNQEMTNGSHGIFKGFLSDSSAAKQQKNIRQTELLANLREAVLIICRHFQTHDPNLEKINTVADYSPESHLRDNEIFGKATRSHCRRAKAVMDFERTSDDELGFRKNDIILVISQSDEHCWTGELNGLKGWFPARFVELLDERGREYSPAGDDSVSESVGDLVREKLCSCLQAIFENGIQQSVLLGTQMHPWLFIEEVSDKEMNKHIESVYARLNLCKAYKLDEDIRILSAEELLYKAVDNINASHSGATLNTKFCSFICCGLNDQVLHLWLNILCSCPQILEKWYHPWSLLRSPAWLQIKCELRILSSLCFTFSVDSESNSTKRPGYPLRKSVRELLVKHHLFSWELQ